MAVPVSRRGSSLRRMLLPTSSWGLLTVVAMLHPALSRGGCFHRVDDMLIAGAAAEIAFQPVADLLFGGIRIIGQKLLGAEHHAWGTKAALQAVLVPEGFLDRIEFAVGGDTLDGD